MATIVIVDDQAANRKIMAQLARTIEDGVNVAAFGNPLEALEYVGRNTPDLVITDYKMMPIDGDEFIRRLRHVPLCADVPTVVVTHFEDFEYRNRAIAAGSTDYLLAPLDHQDFRLRSRTLLTRYRAHLEAVRPGGMECAVETGASLHGDIITAQVEMVNDMLQTVNSQLTFALADLKEANSDIEYLAGVGRIAAIFVDSAFTIRRCTSAAGAMLGMRPNDIGASLMSIAARVDYPGMAADFERVVSGGEQIEKYLASPSGDRHYKVRMLPYQRPDFSSNGVALIFNEMGIGFGGHT